jgi:hypothetical protein
VGKNCEAGESRRNFSNCIGREQWTCGLNGSIFLSTYPGRQLPRNGVPKQRIIKKLIMVRQSNREDEYGEAIHMKMRMKKDK